MAACVTVWGGGARREGVGQTAWCAHGKCRIVSFSLILQTHLPECCWVLTEATREEDTGLI